MFLFQFVLFLLSFFSVTRSDLIGTGCNPPNQPTLTYLSRISTTTIYYYYCCCCCYYYTAIAIAIHQSSLLDYIHPLYIVSLFLSPAVSATTNTFTTRRRRSRSSWYSWVINKYASRRTDGRKKKRKAFRPIA